jgi:hypothetical protein
MCFVMAMLIRAKRRFATGYFPQVRIPPCTLLSSITSILLNSRSLLLLLLLLLLLSTASPEPFYEHAVETIPHCSQRTLGFA